MPPKHEDECEPQNHIKKLGTVVPNYLVLWQKGVETGKPWPCWPSLL